ncbi:N-acetylmannosamine-6-phosphate 2-epimerase [Micropruina sonneratiae]|uniref:N-acetylmannosamine-6-phosphate 2-epimerase n=1 Tax=Micropruina sonneratiae TaxID=2986940 RepID=UPI0022274E7A|nr:N-acetylmannosamine-6-phosphate 2-epimerase [Micropruina sp. KQZ13P-5]MCW3156962.1 N-acetylmannosamine-6-phosphate 2-epimerase [Micropruina sp. KQZ13P-5]
MTDLLTRLAGGVVVSCQAYPGEPMRHPETMAQLAEAALLGGAVGIRAQGLADIELIRRRTSAPLIGLWKDGSAPVFITPTLAHARAVRSAGADIVALDGTRRARPDGRTLTQTLRSLKADGPTVVMADCGSVDDALDAAEAGVDIIGTTLAGYTGERTPTSGPDLELVEQLTAADLGVPIVAEGRYHTPADVVRALQAGAHSVVVGTAITHPTTITSWFVASTKENRTR